MGGDCYEVAAELVVAAEYPGYELVHASVWHPAVGRHGHAWVEVQEPDGWYCIDKSNGHDKVVPRERYYALGKVEDVTRYTRLQTMYQLLEFEHYGPWDV